MLFHYALQVNKLEVLEETQTTKIRDEEQSDEMSWRNLNYK